MEVVEREKQELKEIIENGRINLLPAERVAENIIAAGYQKADEYKAENERLRIEIKRLQVQLEYANVGNVNCGGCWSVEINAVKDFAAKLKEISREKGARFYMGNVLLINDIDELLQEYEK